MRHGAEQEAIRGALQHNDGLSGRHGDGMALLNPPRRRWRAIGLGRAGARNAQRLLLIASDRPKAKSLYRVTGRLTFTKTDDRRSAFRPHRETFAVDPAASKNDTILGLGFKLTIQCGRAATGIEPRPVIRQAPTNEIGVRLLGRRAKCEYPTTFAFNDHVHSATA
jgi:hypothetical protein